MTLTSFQRLLWTVGLWAAIGCQGSIDGDLGSSLQPEGSDVTTPRPATPSPSTTPPGTAVVTPPGSSPAAPGPVIPTPGDKPATSPAPNAPPTTPAPSGTSPPAALGTYFDRLPETAYCPPTRPGGTLPLAYASLCAGCHGNAGEGRPGQYPALTSTSLSPEQFRSVVAMGRKNMPAFADRVPAGDLNDIVNVFTSAKDRGALAGADPDCGHIRADLLALPPAELERRYWTGLQAYRKPGSGDSAACAHCHTADGIDLARFGYTDATILRRALLHTDVAHANEVAEFIHVVRARFGYKRLLHPLRYRPFQPGGMVVSGDTPAEREKSFLDELKKRNVPFFSGPIRTEAEIRTAISKLADIDLREIPVPVELNRWTEDEFRGPGHSHFLEWIPGIGRKPKSDSYFALVDAYLKNPTHANLWAFYDAIDTDTDMMKVDRSGGNMDTLMKLKYMAVQIFGHMVRMNTNDFPNAMVKLTPREGGPGGYHRPVARLAFWQVGDFVRPLDNQHGFVVGDKIKAFDTANPGDYLPWIVKTWGGPSDLTRSNGAGAMEAKALRVTWMVLGLSMEKDLMLTGDNRQVVGAVEYLEEGLAGPGVAPYSPKLPLFGVFEALVNAAAKFDLARRRPDVAAVFGTEGAGTINLGIRRSFDTRYDNVVANMLLPREDVSTISDNVIALKAFIEKHAVARPRASLAEMKKVVDAQQ